MQTVTGIFSSKALADKAIERLDALSISQGRLNLLIPGASATQLAQVPTTETEQPGMGKALGGVVGGAVGASGSLMALAVLSALMPSIGTVTSVELTLLPLVGLLGGVLVGAGVGSALENAMSDGLPKDELFFYQDALRQGRTVLIVHTDDEFQAVVVRTTLVHVGAESLDAARQQWWLGLRGAEAAVYISNKWDFTQEETMYRRGFKAALHPAVHGKPYAEVIGYLQEEYGEVYIQQAFRRGYDSGYASVTTESSAARENSGVNAAPRSAFPAQ